MIYSELAQKVIHTITTVMRRDGRIGEAVDHGLEILKDGLGADRVLIWQVNGDQLIVTNHFAKDGGTCPLKKLSSADSTYLTLTCLSINDGSRISAISLDNELDKDAEWKVYLEGFDKVTSHLLVEIRSGIFIGLLAVQSEEARKWSNEEIQTLESIGEHLSVLYKLESDALRLKRDAEVLKAMTQIASLFTNTKDINASALKSVEIIARLLDFENFKLYLSAGDGYVDAPGGQKLEMDNKSDEFVVVLNSRRGMVVEPGSVCQPQIFDGSPGFILPLIHNESLVGVFALWKSLRPDDYFRILDREVALAMASAISEQISARKP